MDITCKKLVHKTHKELVENIFLKNIKQFLKMGKDLNKNFTKEQLQIVSGYAKICSACL